LSPCALAPPPPSDLDSEVHVESLVTVGEVIDRIRTTSRDESEKGRWFEELVKIVFLESPEYEIDEIEHWGRWRERQHLTGLSGRDTGIDLVARHRNGSHIAIQCKCYASTRRVAKADIDSFLSQSQATDAADQPVFAMRWIVTTSPWTDNAIAQVDSLGSSVRRIDFLQHEFEKISEKLQERPVRAPWRRQREAIDKVVEGLSHHDRGRMIMACGTGKTFTSLRIAESVVPDGGRIAFVAPSIALVAQARREWLLHTTRPLECVVVCSDESAGSRSESATEMRVSELECPVTTSPQQLGELLDPARDTDVTRVVFCTYQSLHRLCDAQGQHAAGAFDLILCDEAHRTTGAISDGAGSLRVSGFQLVHDDDRLRARKRLYMTATPRIYTATSKASLAGRGIETVDMSDLHVYGPELERLSFKEAVETDMLADYRVIVLGVHDSAVPAGMRQRLIDLGDASAEPRTQNGAQKPLVVSIEDLQRLLGTSLAINGMAEGSDLEVPERLDRTIAFANSIARSKFYAIGLADSQLRALITRRRRAGGEAEGATKVEATHLDGTAPAFERSEELRKLERTRTDQCARVICNAKLLTEGVDVPSLDAVVFMEPRDSQVDIVQAVGRVMRRAEGKKLGYIVIPVPVPPGEDLATELEAGGRGYESVGQVLRALQAHDTRLAETPARFVKVGEITRPPPERIGGDSNDGAENADEPRQLKFDLHKAGAAIYAQVVAASGLGSAGKLVADDLGLAVTFAGARFSEGDLAEPLAAALGGLTVDDANKTDICKVAALVLVNACLLHRRLREVPRFSDIPDLARVTGASDPAAILADGWERILEHDYEPVFGPALSVLRQLPMRPFAVEALRGLAECANRTADSLSEMGYDHAGPLYHRILPNAAAYGAFYTKNLSALMLARLAINEDFVDWSDSEQIADLRIMDPACGTGTLLMAALRVLKQRVREDDPRPDGDDADSRDSDLHKAVVENVLHGLDINLPAIQFAASNFTLGAPTVDYRKMNLFTLRHGPQPDGSMMAGTLEVLGFADTEASLRNLVQHGDARSVGAQLTDSGAEFPIRDIDLVIMNPPFTNNTRKHGHFSVHEKKAMQQHELSIRDFVLEVDPAAGGVVDANSISTYFTPIAANLSRRERGVLAKITPSTACTSSSGLNERRFLADRYWIQYVVTSHDPKNINFSENTGIHECLLVARRRDEQSNSPASELPTRFVLLRKMPSTPAEALATADAIASGDPGEWGNVTLWPSERVRNGDWSPVQWYDGDLAEVAHSLIRSDSDLRPAGLNHDFGPAGQRIRETYEACEATSPDVRSLFWSISSSTHTCMSAQPDACRRPKTALLDRANRYWEHRSHVLVAQKFDTISGRLTALWSEEASVGSGWIPVAVPHDVPDKAFVAWWNSTPARLILLNLRTKKLTYPDFSLDQLRSVLVPSPENPAWEDLLAAYEQACDIELLPLRDGEQCEGRRIIDNAAAHVLGVPESTIADWRSRLASEPTISNRPAEASADQLS
ncbi:MAG: hypothetical protein F4005_05995, partial [Acidimicrobiales bacterium]|nr:hypothetical protein [Acidimicrobiales bacterium]